ncbi:MAG: PAS domain S-box protein [Candidatus Omnitrophica bacterium]|nr:PAS domain S-box protein [Candidatus Omnitrophota bacterium]
MTSPWFRRRQVYALALLSGVAISLLLLFASLHWEWNRISSQSYATEGAGALFRDRSSADPWLGAFEMGLFFGGLILAGVLAAYRSFQFRQPPIFENRAMEQSREPDQANENPSLVLAGQQLVQDALAEFQANLARTDLYSQPMTTLIGLDGRWLKVPDALCHLLGYSEEELLARRVQDVTHPQDAEADWHQYQRMIESDLKSFSSRKRYRHKDGRTLWLSVYTNLVVDADNKPVHFLACLLDITKNQQMAERIRAQAELLDLARDAIILVGIEGGIVYWNKGAERLYGWTAPEVVDRDIPSAIHLLDRESPKACLEGRLKISQWNGPLEKFNKTGRKVIVQSRWTLMRDTDGMPQSILVVDTDITENKCIEAQFLRVQRMESIGRLAGGIAHDLNNVLTPILLGVSMLRDKVPSETGRKLLDTIEASAERGANTIKQVLAFARGIGGQRITLQPRYLLGEMVEVIRETFSQAIALETRLSKDLWTIMADPAQIHQALMNLCVNAQEAMPDGGNLTITVENALLDEQSALKIPEAKPGPYVTFVVSDTGSGIAPEIIDSVFDPFFTTKEFGNGAGLGLSTALGIVKDHGGFIQVESRVGQGTEFKVYLPASPAQTPPQDTDPDPLPKGHGQLILFVDDESCIRDLAQGILQENGYRTILAQDGSEAVEIFSKHRAEIHLVVTDLAMPKMDGAETIRALRKMNPELKFIAASGLRSKRSLSEISNLGVTAFLSKPFTPDLFLETIDKTMRDMPPFCTLQVPTVTKVPKVFDKKNLPEDIHQQHAREVHSN